MTTQQVASACHEALEKASQLLEAGEVEPARSLASSVLKAAEDGGDRGLQAHALLALAQFDRVLGRFRRGIDTAQRAVALFQLEGGIAGEAQALSLLAHTYSILGRDAEAVEAALLSVRLGELLPPGPQQVNFYNYLGVAYLWSKAFSSAEVALRESERLALLHAPQCDVLLPRANLAWLEVMRLFKERYFNSELPATDVLRQRLVQCKALIGDGAPFPLLPGVRAVLQRFARFAQALCACWEGDLDQAEAHWQAAQHLSQRAHYAQIANVISHWVRAELSWAQRNFAAAEREALVLITLAGQAEFEQMVYVGHVLMVQIHQSQGRYVLALEQERTLRRRELRIRAGILDSRQGVVQTQLDMRSSAQHLRLLVQHSQELERLSFEDSLTAIANRRRFDGQLASALKDRVETEQPLCVAVIDLNGFKRVNDTYSHAAGDHVLKTVAQAIKTCVRDSDLPARFGGDEFVVLFPRTVLEVAQQACERIAAVVRALHWDSVDAALRISVSIGVAQAVADDTPASLLRRSDLAMFQAKPVP